MQATGQSLLQAKALRDPYYQTMARRGGSDEDLLQAGFFDDGLSCWVRDHSCWAPHMPTTPFGKLLRNHASASPWQCARPIVLLTTGAFSPVHTGHLLMMEKARRHCEAQGRPVLAGYLSPSHDSYVAFKQNGAAALHRETRIALLEQAVSDSDWLDVCPWEARYAPTAVNFSDVLDRLELNLRHQTGVEFDVAYVFGEDNVTFLPAFVERGLAICVARAGVGHTMPDLSPAQAERCWFLKDATSAISSTQVRQGQLQHVPVSARERYACVRAREHGQPTNLEPVKTAPTKIYLIRQDMAHGTGVWPGADEGLNIEFVSRLQALLQNALQSSEPTQAAVVHLLPLARQQHALDTIAGMGEVLNLDVCTTASHRLDFSRCFDMSGGQVRSTTLVERPDYAPIAEQIAQLPTRDWTVVDDDTASGQTQRTVQSLLRAAGHGIKEIQYLNEKLFSVSFLQDHTILDLVDARDFLLGSKDGGLVVRLPGGALARVPYALPFVNLAFRARLPEETTYAVSVAIWELNAWWFGCRANALTVADAAPATQRLLKGMGFATTVPLESVSAGIAHWLRLCRSH